jgi:hypothetical protein
VKIAQKYQNRLIFIVQEAQDGFVAGQELKLGNPLLNQIFRRECNVINRHYSRLKSQLQQACIILDFSTKSFLA